MMIYGHNHEGSRSTVTNESGVTIPISAAAHWSHQGYQNGFYNKDTGEKELMWYAVEPCPWGYISIENTVDEAIYYRIHIDATYKLDTAIKNHVINNIDKTGTASSDQFCVPYGLPFVVEYTRKNAMTLYTKTEG